MRPPGGSGSKQLLRHKNNNQLYVHKKEKRKRKKTFKEREEEARCIKEVDMRFARRNKHTLVLGGNHTSARERTERERESQADNQPARQTETGETDIDRQTDRQRKTLK